MNKLETTLLFLTKDNQILLALKKRGFGVNRYNGIGGKLEINETVEQAMIRETKEEINVTPIKSDEVAVITFNEYFKNQPTIITMHVFISTKWNGEPVETEEMNPKWFDKNDIPFEQMWPDDKFWLPLVIEGNKIQAQFRLDKDDKIISHNIKKVSVL
jgi:mutator protein MutT